MVLPELWSSGYDLERSQMHARVSQEKVLPALTKLARRHHLYILGSVLMPAGKCLTRRCFSIPAPDQPESIVKSIFLAQC